jgi:hypothetical protein
VQRAGGHLGENPVGRLDQKKPLLARHSQAEMVIGNVIDALIRQHPVPGGQRDPRLLLLRAEPAAIRWCIFNRFQ